MNIYGIEFDEHLPTVLPAGQLFAWAKFFMGEPRGKYRYGAIRPPGAKSRWLPAAIGPEVILVACCKLFTTPESAVDWIKSAG